MLRTDRYNLFIVFFFSLALMMSGCKTLNVVGETEEKQDTVSVSTPYVADTIKTDIEKVLVADTVKNEVVVPQKHNDTIPDTIAKKEDVPSVQKKPATTLKSFMKISL